MKKFRWIHLTDVATEIQIISLFDVSREKDGIVFAHGSVVSIGKEYRPIVNKKSDGFEMTVETMSLTDAQEAVEKRLWEFGVIEEDDEIEYAGEE